MSVVSNRYITRAFAEHPIASWPIDDEAYFLSLISNANRNLTTWTQTKCLVTTTPSFSISDETPFKNDQIYYIIGNAAQITTTTNIEIYKSNIFQLNSLNSILKTFCFNAYIYENSSYVNYYEFGYRYLDTQTSTIKEVSVQKISSNAKEWINLQNVFDVTQFDTQQAEIFIRINVRSGGSSGDYDFAVNGLSLGQWSESFCSKNLGSIPELLPASAGLTSTYGLPSEQYGPLSDNAYYVVQNGKLLAKNNSVPMVFGSENCTSLYPSDTSLPSFIFPGKGFLSESGRYRSFTVEFWMRINPNTKNQRRIFGPLDSDYGLYVSEGFISLVIGNEIKTHNIQNWYRPMLIHLVYSASKVSLIINAEQVAEIQINQDNIILPLLNEWIGFYSYSDISLFQIDCLSIFPYEVPLTVAKRRFVWGQGVESQEIIDSSFKGKTASINFPNANYAVNSVYPDKERWDAGSYNNITATTNYIDMPNYQLPNIFLSGRDVNIWYQDNKMVNAAEYSTDHPNFITFRPNQTTRTNLSDNPSFESNTTKWSLNGTGTTIARITTDAKYGSSCLGITKAAVADSGANYATASGSRVAVLPNTAYTASVWVKIPTGNATSGIRIRAITYTAVTGGSTVATTNGTTTSIASNNGWVRLSITITTGATVNALGIQVSQPTAGTAGQQFLVDGLLIEQTDSVKPYFDGSFAESDAKAISKSWTGTASNSTSQISIWSTSGTNWTEKCYLQFSNANILNAPISAIYGVFELKENIATERPLIHIVNNLNGKRFEININSYIISYKYDGTQLLSVNTSGEDHVVAGIHIPTLAQNFGYDISSFFSSYENLEIYVGGAPDTTSKIYETFESKIYNISFCNSDNYSEISNHFGSQGFVNYADDTLINHYATYTLSAFEKYNRFFLDISVSSYWEEYFPLYYFGKYVSLNGADYYDLDLLQFNIGYPSYIEKSLVTVDQNTYEQIYNNQIKLKQIDFSKSSIQMFATFQLLAEGANEPIENFPYTKQLTNRYIVDASLENTTLDPYKAYKTKFYIQDGTIIYPPKNISIEDVALVIHLKINHSGIINNPIQIRNLEISSRALDSNSYNPIPTKFGTSVYPYTKNGIYYDYKNKNACLIGKDNLPYLYLTDKTGMQIIQPRNIDKENGILIPINESKNANHYIAATQIFIKNNIEDALTIPLPIFEINGLEDSIEFLLNSDLSQKRYFITVKNKKTGQQYENIIFYKNGVECKNLYIDQQEWNCISFLFPNPINFSSYTGSLNVFSGINFNNFSYFLSEGLDEIADVVPRIWSEVLSSGTGNNFSWANWYGTTEKNIISNPSFEVNTTGYSSPQTLSLNSNKLFAYNKDKSALVSISNTSNTEVISVDAGTVSESGQTYLITAKFYVPTGSALNGKTITISGTGGSGYTNSTDGLVSPTLIAGQWVTAQRKISMSSTAMPKIAATLNNTTGTSGAQIYIDDWKIEKMIAPPSIKKWRNVYVIDFGTQYSLTPENIFSSYIGTNNNIVDDGYGITVSNDLFTSFSEVLWSSYSEKPA